MQFFLLILFHFTNCFYSVHIIYFCPFFERCLGCRENDILSHDCSYFYIPVLPANVDVHYRQMKHESTFRLHKYRDGHQTGKKVLHKMMDIIMLANADDWVEMEVFGREHESFLSDYLELPSGISSHDTI